MKYSLIFFDELKSTNYFLSEKLKVDNSIAEGLVICADYQTQGRGQATNSWESERGKNLLFSLLLRPINIFASEQFLISQIVALSIKDVLETFLGQQISIKWPNDIYFQEKKIAGILIKNTLCGSTIKESIVGVGLNVNQEIFVSDAPNPISMKLIAQKEFDRRLVLEKILQRFEFYYKDLKEQKCLKIAEMYKDSLYRKTGFHLFENDEKGHFLGKIYDVLPTGQLVLVQKDNGQKMIFSFKEIRFCT